MATKKEIQIEASTEVQEVSWQDAIKAKAAEQASQRALLSVGPKFLSFKGGHFTVDKVVIPQNEIDVIVLTFIAENAYYKGKFDPTIQQQPICWAVYNSLNDMWPSDDVKEKQSDTCEDCPKYQWGSDPMGGRGKACKTRYRIALLPAPESQIPKDILASELRMAVLPVTSGKGFDHFMSKCQLLFDRPIFGVISKLTVKPDEKSQYIVNLEPIEAIPDHMMGAVLKRIDDAEKAITYDMDRQEENSFEENNTKDLK